MAELNVRSSSSKRRVLGGILKLKGVLEKLQKSILFRRNNKSSCSYCGEYDYEEGDHNTVCVQEGHFAVIAEHEEEITKRFLVPLSCLNNSTFLSLLEKAAQEYGFDQHGALTIPCRPSELESAGHSRLLLAIYHGLQKAWKDGFCDSDSAMALELYSKAS
ncbi:hypothetical protein JHK82_031305 [Glycine max]|nr:hypothetical protein JHK85_031958 [Glycine max]KAG4994569.1 hypothetical protein JHK86_031396 [Glycine max]KAG5124568.1 hypothetical protein JHK82_031305 [Glycine max]KAG5145993.1 hypothetical protein JHK84_031536 [Glycine max]